MDDDHNRSHKISADAADADAAAASQAPDDLVKTRVEEARRNITVEDVLVVLENHPEEAEGNGGWNEALCDALLAEMETERQNELDPRGQAVG